MGTENLYFILLSTAVAVLALINIFLYKQRPLQLRLCVLGILLEAGLIFLYYKKVQTFKIEKIQYKNYLTVVADALFNLFSLTFIPTTIILYTDINVHYYIKG